MKKIILTLAILCAAAADSIASAQTDTTGTWVVESNLHTPGTQTVKFYDNKNKLIYSETINARLNVSKKKVQQKLNGILELLTANGKPVNENNMLALSFRIKRD